MKDTSDNMLSVLLSATMTNTSKSQPEDMFSLFFHPYGKEAIYIHLPEQYVRRH